MKQKAWGSVVLLLLVLGLGVGQARAQQTATQVLTLTVAAQPLNITTTTLSNAVIGTGYSRTLTITGGVAPYTWSVTSGSLPVGLTLAPSTGVISGSATTSGTNNFTIQAKDSTNATTTANLSITVAAKLIFTTTTLPTATLGTAYSANVVFTGGTAPFTCSLATGTLPSGLTLTTGANACVISGTPSTAGSSSFTLQVTDNTETARMDIKTPVLYAKNF